MTARMITTADVHLWRDIRLEALRTEPQAFSTRYEDWADRPLADFAARFATSHIFLAFDGARPAGSVSWHADPDVPGRGWITSVFVTPSARGKGIGRDLISAALLHAVAAGIADMFLEVGASNKAAQALYRVAGFAPVVGPDRPSASCGVCEVTMHRSLVGKDRGA